MLLLDVRTCTTKLENCPTQQLCSENSDEWIRSSEQTHSESMLAVNIVERFPLLDFLRARDIKLEHVNYFSLSLN